MREQKDFKGEKPNKKYMGIGYKTYSEAVKNCRSDEITIYNAQDGLYYNVKVFPKQKENFFRLGSRW